MTLPRIVREFFEVDEHSYHHLGDEGIERSERATEDRALATAVKLDWEVEETRGSWGLAVRNAFVEYPMYLLGPGAPRIETAADALAHWPRARYTVTVRCKEEVTT